jgi:hypothetical protein
MEIGVWSVCWVVCWSRRYSIGASKRRGGADHGRKVDGPWRHDPAQDDHSD